VVQGFWAKHRMFLGVFYYASGLVFMLWVLVTTCFNGNVLPPLSILFIKPFSPHFHERILQWLANLGWGSIIDYVEIVGRVQPVITGNIVSDAAQPAGNKIMVCNHVSASDNVAIFVAARTLGHLGHLRFFAKKELLYVPILGWAAYFLGFIFLKRSWHEDKESVFKTFEQVAGSTTKRNFCLVMYPEGTRVSEKKLAESQEFAKSRGMLVLKHVLVPRVKGLLATFERLRSEIDAVVDITVGYNERGPSGSVRPSLADMLLRRDKVWALHLHVRIIPIASIPTEEAALTEWIFDLFAQKDQLLAGFKKDGRFPGPVKVLPPPNISQALRRAAGYMASATAMLALAALSFRLSASAAGGVLALSHIA